MWKNRNFLILMIGVAISGTGMWVGIIGNLEFLQQNIESSFIQALIILAGFIVGIFLAPLAGRIIDNNEKKKVLLWSWTVRVLAVTFMFLAIYYNSILWMVVYTFLMGISGAFLQPTIQTLIPMVVKKEDLISANGINVNIFTAARIIGTAIGALLLEFMSLSSLYGVTMLAFALTLVGTFFLKVNETFTEEQKQKKKEGFVTSIKKLVPIVQGKPKVISGMLLVFPAFLFISGFNLMMIEISEIQDDAGIKGIIYTVEGICVFIGTFLAKRFFNNTKNIKPLLFLSLIIALSQMSLYFADMKWASIASFAMFGMAAGALFPVITTICQTEIDSEYHGRFFSLKGMFENIVFQLLMLLTGLCLDTIGFKVMVITFGSFSLLYVIFIYYTRSKKIDVHHNNAQEVAK
jgi:MFS transporter, DHA3 family, macrolide efflux protein